MIDTTKWGDSSLTGFRFLKRTLSSLEDDQNLFDEPEPEKGNICTYMKMNRPLDSSQPNNGVYFLSFTFSGHVITRDQLCRAWAAGLTGSHFYDAMRVAASLKLANDPGIAAEVERARTAHRTWNDLFAELNLALTSLTDFEQNHLVPERWQVPAPPPAPVPVPGPSRNNLKGLFLSFEISSSHHGILSSTGQLSSLFVSSALRLLEMENDKSYAEDRRSFTGKFGNNWDLEPYVFPGSGSGSGKNGSGRDVELEQVGVACSGSHDKEEHGDGDDDVDLTPQVEGDQVGEDDMESTAPLLGDSSA